MDNHIIFRFPTTKSNQEIALGLLSQFPFEGFEEQENCILAYIQEKNVDGAFEQSLSAVIAPLDLTFKKNNLSNKNWNEIWESNFQPILVDDFCQIRAPFHPINHQVEISLTINPKMAFGTGHHATTYMMISLMRSLQFKGAKVLDFGCGTGLLAIVASKMGATTIVANDIDHWAYENTIENMQLNAVSNIDVKEGDLSVILDDSYDFILANINRNVILDSLSTLYEKLNQNGIVLFSGVLKKDEKMLLEKLADNGFELQKHQHRGDWISCQCTKVSTKKY